jgi:hypothetical protein
MQTLKILTPYYNSWDYECIAELLENLLEHTLVGIDSGLEKKKDITSQILKAFIVSMWNFMVL